MLFPNVLAAGRGGYGAQSGARDENGNFIDHSDVSGPGRAVHESEQQPLIQDSGEDAISRLAKELDIKLDDQSKDYLYQYYLADKASQAAYDRELKAAGSQYQRTVADLRKAGLNPFLAFDSLRGGSVSSTAGSITGGLYTSRKNQKTQSSTQTASAIISVLGIIAAAAMHFLA